MVQLKNENISNPSHGFIQSFPMNKASRKICLLKFDCSAGY